jgi:hypothetical protein
MKPIGNAATASRTVITRINVTSQPYWLAIAWQTPATFLPERGRIHGPTGRHPVPEEKLPAAEDGSVTGFPQAEQKRASLESDAPQPAQ